MEKKEQFIALAKKYEEAVSNLNAVREELNTVLTELGVGTYAQDPETTAVYKVIKPKGTYTYFRDIDYNRTLLEGEKGGSPLAKSDAEAAGFTLKKKEKKET